MIITQTPLRVSFAGGGTDLADYYRLREGFVVSGAIDKAVFVIVSGRYDDQIYVNYSRKEIVDSVNEIEHELVRESMRMTGVSSGVEITMLSDIPSEGSGLGSSSSFTVGLLHALYAYRGEKVTAERLAAEACEIEIARCGKPIGKQDQYIAAYGGVHSFTFRQNETVGVDRVNLSPAELRQLAQCLALWYTDQTRSADVILDEQRQETGRNLEALDELKTLAGDLRDALLAGDFAFLGKALDEGWRLKKGLASGIATGTIDAMHELVMRSGATGAKVCGAGGGGFLMTYCPAPERARLAEAMTPYREMPISFDTDGSKVIFNYRRSKW